MTLPLWLHPSPRQRPEHEAQSLFGRADHRNFEGAGWRFGHRSLPQTRVNDASICKSKVRFGVTISPPNEQRAAAVAQTSAAQLRGGVLNHDPHSADRVALVHGGAVWTRGHLFKAVELGWLQREIVRNGRGSRCRFTASTPELVSHKWPTLRQLVRHPLLTIDPN